MPDKREIHPAEQAFADLKTRLGYCYDPDRVADILAGRDTETERDIARWRLLGLPLN